MSRPRRNKSEAKAKPGDGEVLMLSRAADGAKDVRYEVIVLVVLAAVGVYFSVLYFAHQPVPNPDFTAFVRIGHDLLSFEKPADTKRLPVFGLLVAGLGHVVGGHHPDLTAGWLLNAVLYPLCGILMWRIGKRFVGEASVWLSIIVITNPYLLALVSEPIAEITLLFFVLLTFFVMFKGSRWCYLLGCVTMMVRFEGAALVLAAFVMDMIKRKGKKDKIKSLVCAGAACVPLAGWMLFTSLCGKGMGGGGYVKEMGYDGGFAEVFVKYLEMMWQVCVGSLFTVRQDGPEGLAKAIMVCSKVVLSGGFLFGCVWGMVKKQWEVLALLLFLVPYYIIHVLHSFVLPRYCTIAFWIVLLISLYGLQSVWGFVKMPKRAKVILQSILIVVMLVWMGSLLEFIPKLVPYSPRSGSVPYVLAGAVLVIFAGHVAVYRSRGLMGNIAIVSLMGLMIVSNQFGISRAVGQGTKHIEFKMLAKWYVENVEDGEKMASALPNVLSIYAPKYKDSFVHFSSFKVDSPEAFVRKCYKKKVRYVAWDAVGGRQVGGKYYKLWGFKNIAILSQPRSVGPYEFVTQIKASESQYINVFRLREIDSGSQTPE